jgi:hypothetical protein
MIASFALWLSDPSIVKPTCIWSRRSDADIGLRHVGPALPTSAITLHAGITFRGFTGSLLLRLLSLLATCADLTEFPRPVALPIAGYNYTSELDCWRDFPLEWQLTHDNILTCSWRFRRKPRGDKALSSVFIGFRS